MAVPHVAGAAALYLEQNPTATPAQVLSLIKHCPLQHPMLIQADA